MSKLDLFEYFLGELYMSYWYVFNIYTTVDDDRCIIKAGICNILAHLLHSLMQQQQVVVMYCLSSNTIYNIIEFFLITRNQVLTFQ